MAATFKPHAIIVAEFGRMVEAPRGESVSFAAFPDVVFTGDELLG